MSIADAKSEPKLLSSISTRIALGVAVVSILTGVAAFLFYNNEAKKRVRVNAMSLLKTDASAIASTYYQLIEQARNDLMFLKESASVAALARLQLEPNAELETIWSQRLIDLLKNFAKAKPHYNELRMIGLADNGRELVRINHYDGVEVVPRNRLQSKSHRQYFLGTTKVPDGGFYVGDITLRQEFGQVVEPHFPQLRIGTPVFHAGKLVGVFIVNLDHDAFLHQIGRLAPPDIEWILGDSRGNYVRHFDERVENFGPEGANSSFRDFSFIDQKTPVNGASSFEANYSGHNYFGSHIRIPYSEKSEKFFDIIVLEKKDIVYAAISSAQTYTLYWITGLVTFSMLLLLAFLNFQLRPIRRLTQALQESPTSPQIPDELAESSTELGILARTVDDALLRLRSLDDEIAKNTKWIEGIIQNTPGMVYQFKMNSDQTMYFPFVSQQAYDIYEVTVDDFEANPSIMLEMAHDDDKEELNQKILESATQMEPFEWQGRIVSKTGKVRTIMARSVPAKTEDGGILWDGIVVDVSKQVELQQRLDEEKKKSLHTAKLASIGELAAGVGHEINNPLAIATGCLNRIDKFYGTETNPKVRKWIENADYSLSRIATIVNGLRTYARSDDVAEKVVDIHQELQRTTALLGEVYKSDGIELNLEVKAANSHVQGNSGKLQQVFMNLLANARDALKDKKGGLIQVRTSNLDDSIVIEVIDNGCGMSSEVQSKIFDAFFTTKPVGEGTGMGMGIVHDIISKMNGTIEVASMLGRGASFKLTIPTVKNP